MLTTAPASCGQSPKDGRGVSLPLCPITRHVSWVLHRNGPRDVGRLFAVTKQLLRQDWREAREAIGRPGLLFKDLRHSFAQHLEDAGEGDLITDALQDADPRLRRRYAKVQIERLRQRLDALGTVPGTVTSRARRSAG